MKRGLKADAFVFLKDSRVSGSMKRGLKEEHEL